MMATRISVLPFAWIIVGLISACTSKGPDIPRIVDETTVFYSRNREELHMLRDILLEHPQISHVSDLDTNGVPHWDKFHQGTRDVYMSIKARCESIGVKIANVDRILTGPEAGKLLSVSFIVYSVGIVDGLAVQVVYVPTKSSVDALRKHGLVRMTEDDDWYVTGNID